MANVMKNITLPISAIMACTDKNNFIILCEIDFIIQISANAAINTLTNKSEVLFWLEIIPF